MASRKFLSGFLFVIILFACGKSNKTESIELITTPGKQDTIFRNLLAITNHSIPLDVQYDSLVFMILPIQASCPSCRNKTIDSIVKYRDQLAEGHFIIISANGGRKTISAFFKERGKELPIIERKLFLDSTNQAFKFELYYNKPTIYYVYNGKAYKKVAGIPSTIRDDLREFFSGKREL